MVLGIRTRLLCEMPPTSVSRFDARQTDIRTGCPGQQILNGLAIAVQGFLANPHGPFLKKSRTSLDIGLHEIPELVFLNPSTECGECGTVGTRRTERMNLCRTLVISSTGSQCQTPPDNSLGLLLRFRIVTHEYHLLEELMNYIDRPLQSTRRHRLKESFHSHFGDDNSTRFQTRLDGREAVAIRTHVHDRVLIRQQH